MTETIRSRPALREHRAIVERLEELNPAAARRIGDAIVRRVGQLEAMPRIGRPGRVIGTRELVIVDTSYIVVYEYEQAKDRVEILHVTHGAMRWPPR